MKNRVISIVIVFILGFQFLAKADEGMWLPLLLGKNYDKMVKLGLKLTPQQLYDINNASLKDAIVMLDNGGCTGEVISDQGLILTNHHCGYGEIQAHSTIEHDYLADGFWAMSQKDELSNPSKVVSFLIRIEDVTSAVLADVKDNMNESERDELIKSAISKLVKAATKDNGYNAKVKSMFSGNEYYLFVYETYYDVRLVGAPPSSIGKFGGDTDNWMWPRHTGDFSIFRVYMGKDGKPAKYSKDNIPYKPKHFLPISLNGIKENDFAMIWGNPGTTDRYLPSYGIKLKIDQINPGQIKLKDAKMKIMKEAMDRDRAIKIQYASKYAYLGNFWKKDIEESKALIQLKVYDQKKALENDFNKWVNADESRKQKYGNVISDIEKYYKDNTDNKYQVAFWYFVETYTGAEIAKLANQTKGLIATIKSGKNDTTVFNGFRKAAKDHFKDYNADIDKKILAKLTKYYFEDIPLENQPEILAQINKKYKGDFDKYVEDVFKKSIFVSMDKIEKFLSKPSAKVIENDPAVLLCNSLFSSLMSVRAKEAEGNAMFEKAKRLFTAGIHEMYPDKIWYPDANSTMRCTYGSVLGYHPRDAVSYDYITYLDGIMEKEDSTNEEFIVPAKLKALYKAKDYRQYGMGDKMPVCFLTNNDITGGNSGSPVINGKGELIGTAFDGNSEAMSSDIQFNTELQRTIVCDIRYVLFIIDKYAGAKNLVAELKLVKD